jgi:hypothetical protein
MKMPKNVDLSKSINREKVIEPSIANNEKNIECPPLVFSQFYNKIYVDFIVDSRFQLIKVKWKMQEQWPYSKMAMPNTELDWWKARTKEKESTR